MITILRSTPSGLETTDHLVEGCWVNVVNPSPEECESLQVTLDVPPDFITYPLDLDERARSEREDGATLIILRVPLYEGPDADVVFSTVPLGIILTETCIVTICRVANGVIDGLLAGRPRGLSTAKRIRFLLYLLRTTATMYLTHLREIDRTVDILEDRLERSLQNREVLELLRYQKSLTYFTTALKSNELLLQRLQRSHLFHAFPEDAELLEDVLTEVQQAIEMTNISSNILSQMMDAFASIISNNLNVVMKILALLTIVMSIPTMVASFYGMNVDLPMQESPHAFGLTITISTLLAMLVVAVFIKARWL